MRVINGRKRKSGSSTLASIGLFLQCLPSGWAAAPGHSADAWPRLGSEIGNGAICEQALELGMAQFNSRQPLLFLPPTVPQPFGSSLIQGLGPTATDPD
jgi:hypothetical protein